MTEFQCLRKNRFTKDKTIGRIGSLWGSKRSKRITEALSQNHIPGGNSVCNMGSFPTLRLVRILPCQGTTGQFLCKQTKKAVNFNSASLLQKQTTMTPHHSGSRELRSIADALVEIETVKPNSLTATSLVNSAL